MASDSQNVAYRQAFFTQRDSAVNGLMRDAEIAQELGDFTTARQTLGRIGAIDAGNLRLPTALDRLGAAERHAKMLDAAAVAVKEGGVDAALSKTQQVLSENPNHRRAKALQRQLLRQQADITGKELGIYPKLKAIYRVPVSLSFNNATVVQVFEALKQASGLNYMIEKDVKTDLRVTLSVTNKPVEDIVRLVLATNQLDRRILDSDTLLIYPNTQAKQADYRELVVRSFYLSNAEASKVASVVRTISKARDVVVDEKLNMLMVRDSEEVIRLAEKIIASEDLAEPEVMLELEVMEVSVNRLIDLGIEWPSAVSGTLVGLDGVAGQLRLSELRRSARHA